MIKSEQFKGLGFILLADLLWGLSGTVAKHLFNQQVSPYDLVQIRLILAFLFLGTYLAIANPRSLKIERKDAGYFIIFGLFGVATVQFTYLYTVSETNVATAVFLEYLAPVFILLYGLLTRKEIISLFKVLALILATTGGLLIVKGTTGAGMAATTAGLISGLASAVSFAFYTLYGKYGLGKYSPWTLMFWGMGVGGAAWALYRPPWITFTSYGAGDWIFFFYIAVFATVLPFGFFFKGLSYLTPVVTGITSTMEPVLAGLTAYIILGEVLTGMQLLGCAMILTAVVLVQLRTERQAAFNQPVDEQTTG
ncbi:EamA family transporter [Desulfallas sp. Bu1-1]|uniref:DMT family transporter n=1 Tax=Desulfallas sp. Bu1-1 TaxID=2787620 RepID=UPI00189FD972|nr:DMT family transporter [Desulfallas sp. Bu1-1]MBF7082298.1 EamA family transporter [Desulfallas sp. Bu1-1]